MRLKHFLSVFLTLLTLSVGQMWGAYTTAPAGTYALVTDASTLSAGDVIIIVNSTTAGPALSTTQNGNNRGQTAVTVSSSKITLAAANTVQGLTLEAGTTSGTFAFNTGNGYLFAASSSSNYLRTEANKSANSSWSISISSGTATMTAQGTNTRNKIKYNSQSSIFSCYSSGTAAIFKKITLSSIAVKTAPTKTTYTEGEYFAPTGLVITLTYSDNSTEDITYNNTTASDFTFSPSTALTTGNTSVSITYGGKSTSQAITVAASAAPSYDITAQSNNTNYGTVSLSGSIITGLPKAYCRYASPAYTVASGTATVSQNGNAFTVTPSTDCAVTINFEPIPVTGVTIKESAVEVNALSLEVGGSTTLTATVAPNTANPGVNWTVTQADNYISFNSSTGAVSALKAGTATITATSTLDNTKTASCTVTVNPVAEYKKVTAALTDWSGEYLLVYESGTKANVWTGVDAANCYAEATITSNTITKPANGVKLIIEALTGNNAGKYSIKIVGGTNNGKYIGKTASGNGMDIGSTVYTNTISYENSTLTITASGGNTLRYNSNSDQKRFRYFGSGQQAVQLYRKVVTSAVTITAPTTGTGTLTLANGQTPVASGDNIAAGTELTVTATPNAGNHYIGGTISVKKTSDNSDVPNSVWDGTTLTMPEYAITVSATFTPTYEITGASVTGGTFSWEDEDENVAPAYVAAGVLVQASANADPGYVFSGTYDIYQTGATSTKVTHASGLFTMPAYAVTIGGTFNQAPTINLSQTSTMAFTKVATGASTSAKFTVSAANLTVGSLSVSKSGTNADKFGLSLSSITVTAGSVSNAEVTVTPVTSATGDFTATITVDDGENGAAAQSFNVTLHVEDQYTINWYVNGSAAGNIVKSQTAFANEDLDIPTASDLTPFTDCSQFVFLGWKDGSAIDGGSSESAPTLANVGTKVAASKSYYAVFGDGSPAVDESDSWDLETASDDWTGNNTETYFTKPYGIKKANAYIVNSSISDFENYANGADEISITVTCFQNSGSTSRLTVYLVDEDGAIIAGTGKEFTPANGSQVSDATDAEVTYNASELSGKDATGYMVKCTTYGKNILITGTGYQITKAESYSKYYTTCPQIKNVVLSAATVSHGSISFKVGGKAATNARTENGAVEVDIVETHDTGYELTGIALSALSGASYNSTTKKIELAKNTNGSLTVTPTFSQKNYSISVESYPASIGATLTGTTSTAKYGVEQTISTNEPTGYIFGGWYIYDSEDTEKETDLSEELFSGTYAGGDLELEASFLMPDKNLVAEAYFDEIHDVAWALENTPSSGSSAKVYVKGLISKIDSYQSNTITYWISDNGQHINGTVLEVFKGKGVDNANFTAIGNLTVGDEVIVYGQLKTYSGTKEFDQGNYLYSRTAASLSSVVVSAPDASLVKTEYFGTTETFSYAGLKATAEYNTGYQKDVTDDATWKANGSASFTVTTGGTVNVTATYGGETSPNYGVAVTVTTKTLESITVSPAALTGYKGQALPKPTTVTANFDDQGVASSSNVTAQAVYDEAGDYSASSTSAQTIAVKYTFGPTTKSANYTVTLSSVANTVGTAYSVEKAQEIIELDKADGNDLDLELAANKAYVIGRVKSVTALTGSNTGKYTIVLEDQTDNTKTIELFRSTYGTGITSVEVGDVIKAYGNLYWYAGGSKYEINEGGQVVWKQPKVSITIANKTLEVGDVWTIAATIDPAAAPVTYSIKAGSDECIALNDDEITATAVGTATIVVTAEDYNEYLGNSKEFTVTVSPAKVHTDVIILAEYSGHYYALNNTAGTTEVQFENGMVIVPDQDTKMAILWDRAEREGVATFYNATANKFLKGGTNTTLGVATEEDTYTSWTWVETETKAYYTSNSGASARTFMYMDGQAIKNYAVSNIGNGSYAQANVYAGAVAVKISSNTDVSDLPENASVLVENGVTLTVDAASTLDNLIVEAGGTVEVAGSNELTVVNNLTIQTTSGSTENEGKSGQLTGSVMPVVSGDLFIEIKLCEGAMNAEASRKWYCISAPFNVNMNGGFFWGDGTPMVLNTDFQLFEWDGDRRATGISGWKRVSGVMKAGIAYFIGFDDERSNQNIIKLKATNKTISNKSSINAPEHSSSVDDKYANWNGLANPNFRHIALNKDVQAFDHNIQAYTTYATGDYNFVVGTPFFIKETGDITIEAADNSSFRAPKREVEQLSYCVRIVREGKAGFDNQMYVRASEEASTSYEEGHDLVTMNAETSNYGALLWTVNYGGKRLAIEEAPLVNDKASYALSLYAPADGAYRIETPTVREDASLYLTYEGNIIWDLSAGAYELDLNKGATEGYGLMLVRKAPQVTTGVENVQGDKTQCTKVILNDHVYILRDAQLYDVTGKAVK